MQFNKPSHNSSSAREVSHRTKQPIAGLDRSMRGELLAVQRSAGNAALARLARVRFEHAVIQRKPLGRFERDRLTDARTRLSELEEEYRHDRTLVLDALRVKNPVLDSLHYLHSMNLGHVVAAISAGDAFFREARQLAQRAVASDRSLDAFLRKVNWYDRSGGKNAIKAAVADLDHKLRLQERDELSQIVELDEEYLRLYRDAPKPPLTVYRGEGRGVGANSLHDFAFADLPAVGVADFTMFGVVEHTHTNAAKNGMVSTSTSLDVARYWATFDHDYGLVFTIMLDNYIHVANLLGRRNFKNRFPRQFEVLALGTIPASKVVSAALYRRGDKEAVKTVLT